MIQIYPLSKVAIPESKERVSRFSGLRDEEADVVAENGGVAVQEVRRQVHHDLRRDKSILVETRLDIS